MRRSLEVVFCSIVMALPVSVVGAQMQMPMDPNMPGMQHDMPGMQHGNTSTPQGKPAVVAPQNHENGLLQEPENPEHRSGSVDASVPELLKDVAGRKPVSLAELQAMAETHNPTLRQAEAQIKRAEALAKQAALWPNLQVGYEGDQIRGGSYGGGEHGAFVQQTIPLGNKRGLESNVYKRQKGVAEIALEEQRQRVLADLQHGFYETLAAQAEVDVRRGLLAIASDAVVTVHQLANVGQADAPDILQTEVETEQAMVDYVTAQRQYLQAFRTLAALAGKGNMPVSPLQGELEKTPDLNAEQLVDSIVAESPTVKRAQQEAAVAQARLKDAKRESVPDLQLRAGEQYNGEHVRENPTKAAGAQSFASAGINIPLWNRNQGNVGAAKAEIERAEQDVARAQLSLRQQAAPLAQSYLSAQFEADRYKTQLIPRAGRAYELYLKKYQDMAQAYPQVLVSQRTFFQLQVGYITALHDVWRSAIALENYTLNGGLQSPMSSGSSTTTINPPNAGGAQE